MIETIAPIDGQTLPHSLDAERSVLGAILVHGEAWGKAASVVGEGDFFRDGHRRTFAAMKRLVERGVPVDFPLLREELSRVGDLDAAGGAAYVASLADGMPRATNVEYYAAVVREKARLRGVIFAAGKLQRDAYEAEDASAQVVERGIRELALLVDAQASGVVRAQAGILDYIKKLDEGSLGEPVQSGFADLDALTGGFKPGDLVFIAARPSVGKTAFALTMAEHMAQTRRPTVFFSAEMSQEKIMARLLALRSGVPSRRLERGECTPEEHRRIATALEAPDVPLYVQAGTRTVTEADAWIRKLKQDGELHVFVADYMTMFLSDGDDDERGIAALCRAWKRLCGDHRMLGVVLSQLSRKPEARKDPRPHLSDLRGSGALEQDADVTLLLFREEMHTPRDDNAGIAECIVAKNRDGPVGVVKLQFQADLATFRNLING